MFRPAFKVNLPGQLMIVSTALVMSAVILTVGLTYALLHHELEQQAWQRVEDAGSQVQGALLYEQAELQSLARLAAERPTLLRLAEAGDIEELEAYLRVFQEEASLTSLSVELPNGEMVGSLPPTDAFVLRASLRLPAGGRVLLARVIDRPFLLRLTAQTGFQLRIVEEVEPPFNYWQNDTRVYGGTMALNTIAPGLSGALEIALPVTGVLASEWSFLGLLLVASAAVGAMVSLPGALFVRTRLRPLWQVIGAARLMGQGDLTSPITTHAKAPEVRVLATTLEETRARLSSTLEALSQAHNWSDSLLRSLNEGILSYDEQMMITFANAGAEMMMALPGEAMVGKRLDAVLTLEHEDPGALIEQLPAEGSRRTWTVRRPDGMPFTVAVTRSRPLVGLNGARETTLVLHDITADAQQRSLQAYFLANVSHEFRTPLAGMKVSIELLLENMPYLTAREVSELMNSLYLSVTSLQSLIDNLLESSKIEANRFTLRRKPGALNPALSEAIRLTQPFLNRRQQMLTLDQPLTLPPLTLDQTRVVQVLVNLLSNASKYSPMQSPIELLVEADEAYVRIAVADRGQGIPEARRAEIFHQFVRLDRDARVDYSAGLGLAVVKTIVEAHGGTVGVNARPDGGSLFWFTLPVERAKENV